MGTNFKGVIGMSLRIGAILPAGHFANGHSGTAKRVLLFLLFFLWSFQTGFRNSMMKAYMPYINKGWVV
jgi:hypothetical protein